MIGIPVLPEGAVEVVIEEAGYEEPETGTETGIEAWTVGFSPLPPSGCETGAPEPPDAVVEDISSCDTVRSVLILSVIDWVNGRMSARLVSLI